MKPHIPLVIAVALLAAASSLAMDHAVNGVKLSPEPPTRLENGTDVQVSFRYRTTHRRGVRIFVRPLSRGALSEGYAASGSSVYEVGSGRGRASFTIRSGSVTVDQIRLQMVAADSRRVLFETRVGAGYTFGQLPRFRGVRPVEGPELRVIGPAVPTEPATRAEASADTPPCDSSQEVLVHPDGSVEIVYPDGSRRVIETSGSQRVKPAGSDNWTMILPMQIQRATPPDELMSLDQEWLESMNAWLEVVAQDLLGQIRSLSTSEDAVDNYLQFEQVECPGIYQQIDCRVKIVSTLMGGL